MTAPRDHDGDLADHDADLADHDPPIRLFAMRRSGRSRWAETRRQAHYMAHIPAQYHARMPLPRSLCFTLAEAAGRSWDLLGRSRQARIALSEETITETLLIDLQNRHPSEVLTYKFSRPAADRIHPAGPRRLYHAIGRVRRFSLK